MDGSIKSKLTTRTASVGIGAGFVLLLVALFVGLFFPTFQTIGYVLLVQIPAIWWWAIIGMVGTGIAYSTGHKTAATAVIGLALVMMLIVAPIASGIYAQQDIVNNQEFAQTDSLDDTSTEHVRVLPQNVADTYAESANQLPKYQTGNSDIAYHDGNYTWAYPIVADRLFVSWRGTQWGAFYVGMEQTDRSVSRNEQSMQNGLGQLFIDSFSWQTNAARYDVRHKPGTTFVFEHEGEQYIAKSYVRHEWKFRFAPIPQPYTVPKYGGTLVMDSDGNIEDLSPEEVQQSEKLRGQNTYPYDLARFRMTSMQLRNGVLNKWFVGDGVPKIADTGSQSDNSQPFAVPVDGEHGPELEYYIAATPAGSGDGIYQVYQIDGQSGSIEYVQFDDTRAGPSKAAGYTRSQNREPTWAIDTDEGSTQITEPIPLMIDDNLFWHMRVTPTDGSQISYTTFVDAQTGDVYRAESTAAIMSFIESEGTVAESNETDTGPSQDESEPAVTVHVISDGEVDRTIEVDQNESIRIDPNTGGSNATALP